MGSHAMSELIDQRRRRLAFQSVRRGTKETDLILGDFVKRHFHSLTAEQLDRYEALLRQSDPDLLDWIAGRCAVPREFDHDIMLLLKSVGNNSA